MGSFYELAFPDISFNLEGDTQVCCPFAHTTASGETYFDTNPSMSVDIEKGIHHCFSCGAKGNELQFISEFMKIDFEQANQLKAILDNSHETAFDWQKTVNTLHINEHILEMIHERYKFNDDAIDKLQIGVETAGKGISFPVFLFGKLVDVISYNPENKPKYRKRTGSANGIIMPYDSWKDSKKHTLIVAGQKDLGIALTKKFNAIAITGGEGEIPSLFLNDFRGRTVFIVFDNDDTGKRGAQKVASAIQPYADMVKILDISETCIQKGEDLWDYFVKYGKTKKDLVALIKEAPVFTKADAEVVKELNYPTVSLSQAVQKQNIGKILRSSIQVIANDENQFLMPTAIKATKFKASENSPSTNRLNIGQSIYWNFSKKKAKELFYLIDSSLKEWQIKKNIKELLKYPKEYGLVLHNEAQETVYKCTVTDYFEATSIDDKMAEFTAYAIGHKLESGNKYKITYKIVPHPHQGGALYMVVFDVEENQDSITSFEINEENIELLKPFQVPIVGSSLEQTLEAHVERVKGIVHADYNHTLLKTIDLWYHTPLQFDLGNRQKLRAYLDTLVIAESRVGKTTTVQALQKVYGLGTRVPLNGKNASVAGIIGGSHKTRNGFQIRAGLLPRSHKGAIIFEELGKASKAILAEIGDVRSSGFVTITRVSGSTTLPAFVRMLTLSNPRLTGGIPTPISSYPNGIEIITDLVGTAEDIARYDMIAILASKGASRIDAFFTPPEPFTQEQYQARIRWIWSRESHQVVISKEIYEYAIDLSNEANKTFNSYIKIFGTEAWLKLLRVSIAVAGYVVSTDETFENIVVRKEHIDYSMKFILSLYDNQTFRLRQFVEAEKKYRDIDSQGIQLLQEIWNTSSSVLKTLEDYSRSSQKTLQIASGLDSSSFNLLVNKLVTGLFIRFDGYDIVPTERFRKGMASIDRNIKIKSMIIG